MANSAILSSGKLPQLILMEAKLIKEEKVIVDNILREANAMKKYGYSKDELNEGIADMLANFAGKGIDAALDTLKATIIDGLLSIIGLDPQKPGGWGLLGCAISNSLENLEMKTFSSMFTKGKAGFSEEGFNGIWKGVCDDLTKVIMKGVAECGVQTAQRSKMMLGFYKAIVGDAAVEDAKDSFLWKTSDEMLQNTVSNSEFMAGLSTKVSGWLCSLDLSEMMSKVSGSLGGMASGMLGMLGIDIGGKTAKA
jgi:hypothetical protein